MPRVTVIIPCYNREEFIKSTIDSALLQTYKKTEVIAVDDGSTDGTRKILDGYGGLIRVLEHPGRANRGQSAAINLAIRSSESEYVAVLDSDDLWAPQKIERQVNFLEARPEIGLVYSNGYAIDENGSRLYSIFPAGHKETNRPGAILLDCYAGCPSGHLVRRRTLDEAGDYDEELRSAQDHDMLIRLAEITKLAFLNEDLWFYRIHGDTLSQKYARRRWQLGFRILEKACKRYNYGPRVRRKRLAVLNYRLWQCVAAESGLVKAMPFFLKAGIFDPLRAVRVVLGKEDNHNE